MLIGAATGIYHYVPRDDRLTAYAFTPVGKLRGGVNAAVLFHGHIYATHSEVGVLRWPLHAAAAGQIILQEYTRDATAIRDIQAGAADTLWFAAADRVIGWSPGSAETVHNSAIPSPDVPSVEVRTASAQKAGSGNLAGGPLPSTSLGTLISMGSVAGSTSTVPTVTALHVAEQTVFAGTSDGRLLEWPCDRPEACHTLLSGEGGPIDSLQWMSAAGVERLLITARRPNVSMLVRGDVFRLEFRADEPLRWAAACDDWVVAVNDRRDRLFIWRPWQPDKPERVIHVVRQVGHSIQNVALWSEPV